jgi:hypothetical protein
MNIKRTVLNAEAHALEETDGYVCKVATTKEEISTLIEAGFEYVCERDELQFFRKPK